MQLSKKQKHLKNMIAFSLLMYIVIGTIGTFVNSTGFKHLLWALSAFFMIIGSALLGSKLTRDGHDIPAAGFIILSIAQGLNYGFIATHDVGKEQFGAMISILVPGLILISLYNIVFLIIRIVGFLSAAAFAALAIAIYVETTDASITTLLTIISYLMMNFTLLGWAWLIYKNKL